MKNAWMLNQEILINPELYDLWILCSGLLSLCWSPHASVLLLFYKPKNANLLTKYRTNNKHDWQKLKHFLFTFINKN